jgi:hypothetical protein
LQGPTPDDGGSDEVAGVRRIDDVDPDVVFPRRHTHGPIHLWLIGRADDECTAHDIVGVKRSRLMLNDALYHEGG